jgi:hypothetical protein
LLKGKSLLHEIKRFHHGCTWKPDLKKALSYSQRLVLNNFSFVVLATLEVVLTILFLRKMTLFFAKFLKLQILSIITRTLNKFSWKNIMKEMHIKLFLMNIMFFYSYALFN